MSNRHSSPATRTCHTNFLCCSRTRISRISNQKNPAKRKKFAFSISPTARLLNSQLLSIEIEISKVILIVSVKPEAHLALRQRLPPGSVRSKPITHHSPKQPLKFNRKRVLDVISFARIVHLLLGNGSHAEPTGRRAKSREMTKNINFPRELTMLTNNACRIP